MTEPSQDFLAEINKMCNQGVDVMDAVVSWCYVHKIDVETVAQLIKRDSNLKNKLQCEAEALKMVKPSGGKLPL